MIHQELMANADYRMRFADRAQMYLTHGGLLTPAVAAAQFRALSEVLGYSTTNGGPMVAESARWGSTSLNKNTWMAAVDNEINNFFPNRAATLLSQLKNTVLPTWRGSTSAPLYPNLPRRSSTSTAAR